MPLTILPGIIQLARSPHFDTCKPPNNVKSICPPRIMAKDSSEPKIAAPGKKVIDSLPALILSGSSSPGFGYGP